MGNWGSGDQRQGSGDFLSRGLETSLRSLGERPIGESRIHEKLLLSKDPESTKNPTSHLTQSFWNRRWTVGVESG